MAREWVTETRALCESPKKRDEPRARTSAERLPPPAYCTNAAVSVRRLSQEGLRLSTLTDPCLSRIPCVCSQRNTCPVAQTRSRELKLPQGVRVESSQPCEVVNLKRDASGLEGKKGEA